MDIQGNVTCLWMPKFISHEVEVSMATNCKCNQSDHLNRKVKKIIRPKGKHENNNWNVVFYCFLETTYKCDKFFTQITCIKAPIWNPSTQKPKGIFLGYSTTLKLQFSPQYPHLKGVNPSVQSLLMPL